MLTPESFEERQLEKEIFDEVQAFDRFVDIAVRLAIVVADPNGKELVRGKPLLRVVGEPREFGGILDTKAGYVCGKSSQPREWFCSEDQWPLILHADTSPMGQIVIGSEGAGKTTAQAMWHYLRWLEHMGEGREGGQTAPVQKRLGLVRAEVDSLWRPEWKRFVDRPDFTGYELCDGTRIRFQHTHRQSAADGSPIQGFNWSWAGRDEMQDQVDVHEDIETRGRAAKGGGTRYKQFGTATAKDDAEWRTLRDKLVAAKRPDGVALWGRSTLYGVRSPFVAKEWWEIKKASMPLREYRRRVECIDVGPERATYAEWDREHNLINVPEIGWVDVTARELRPWGGNFEVLGGHDPGALWDVTLLLKAYVRNQNAYARGIERPFWVVHGEVNTEQSTTAVHIAQLLEYIRDRWHLNLLTTRGLPNPNAPQILVRADPADSADRTDPNVHKSVYTQFTNAGIKIKPAAYNAENDGHGKVPKDPGIEVIRTLICSASNERRLFVERLPNGAPAAPQFVAAIEQCQRDEKGKAETRYKDGGRMGAAHDKSHWTACARYALWAIERPRLQSLAQRNA